MNEKDERIMDLEVQVESLSDILAEKDRKIKDLEDGWNSKVLKIRELEVRIKRLSDILAEKDRRIKDLEAQVENSNCILAEQEHKIFELERANCDLNIDLRIANRIITDFIKGVSTELHVNDFDTTYYRYEGEGIPKLDRRLELSMLSSLIFVMTLKGAADVEIRDAVMYSMVVIDCEKKELDWRKAKADFRIEELEEKYFPIYQREKHSL